MAERVEHHTSLERARNAAIAWLEDKGVRFGGQRQIVIGKLRESAMLGREVGVASPTGHRPFWRLRLDYDPDKGCHYNAEFAAGTREKVAFCFPGSESLIQSIAKSRAPR